MWVWVQRNHHFIVIFLLIWILNQDRNFFCNNWIDIFISPRFKCVIVDIFTMLMLRSFGLCLKKCITHHSGWRPRGIVTHFIRQSPKDRSITTLLLAPNFQTCRNLNETFWGWYPISFEYLTHYFVWFQINWVGSNFHNPSRANSGSGLFTTEGVIDYYHVYQKFVFLISGITASQSLYP